jgi:ADP-ribose pyrophosphatase YjhB (NUDIX family)
MADGSEVDDFGFHDWGNASTVVCAYYAHEGLTVILQRSYKPVVGRMFPGVQAGGLKKHLVEDHFEEDETPGEAAAREAHEECGATVLKMVPLNITTDAAYRYPSKLRSREYLFVALVEEPRRLVGDAREGTEPFSMLWADLRRMFFESSEIDPIVEEFDMAGTKTLVLARPILDRWAAEDIAGENNG